MPTEEPQIVITDNRDERRYEIRAGGELAGFSEYSREPNVLTFLHTEIDPAFEGRGLGSKLAGAALDDARAQHAQLIPLCPFIAAYIGGHPGYDDIVAPSHRRRIATMREHESSARG
jgi:uncharacterized protein